MAWLIIPQYGYRTLLAVTAIPFFVSLWMIVMLLVESPRWLLAKGRNEEAQVALAYIAETNGTSMPCRRLVSQADEGTPLTGEDDNSSMGKKVVEEYRLLIEKTGWFLLLALSGAWFGLGFTYTSVVLFQGDLQGTNKSMGPCHFEYAFTNIVAASEILGGILSLPLVDQPDLFYGGRKGVQLTGYLIVSAAVTLGGYKVPPKMLLAGIARAMVNAATGATVIQGPETLDVSVRGTGTGYLAAMCVLGCLAAPYWVFASLSSKVIALGIAASTLVTMLFVSMTPETALIDVDTPEMRRQATPDSYDEVGKPRRQ
jgi:hypothetical protein